MGRRKLTRDSYTNTCPVCGEVFEYRTLNEATRQFDVWLVRIGRMVRKGLRSLYE